MREVSLRIDRYLVNTRITPNQLTYLMTVCGVLAAPALLVPGITGAVLGVVAVQLYLLLDCVDGEGRALEEAVLARRRLPGPGRCLPDRRRGPGRPRPAPPTSGAPDGSTGCGPSSAPLAALGAILIKAETDLVGVARHQTGKDAGPGVRVRAALLRHGAGPPGPPGRSSSTG